MTTAEIIMDDINNDLKMCKKWLAQKDEFGLQVCRKMSKRSWVRAKAKWDLALSLGYAIVFDDARIEVIAVYPTD